MTGEIVKFEKMGVENVKFEKFEIDIPEKCQVLRHLFFKAEYCAKLVKFEGMAGQNR